MARLASELKLAPLSTENQAETKDQAAQAASGHTMAADRKRALPLTRAGTHARNARPSKIFAAAMNRLAATASRSSPAAAFSKRSSLDLLESERLVLEHDRNV